MLQSCRDGKPLKARKLIPLLNEHLQFPVLKDGNEKSRGSREGLARVEGQGKESFQTNIEERLGGT
jgi:hypothetical protein